MDRTNLHWRDVAQHVKYVVVFHGVGVLVARTVCYGEGRVPIGVNPPPCGVRYAPSCCT